MSTGQVLGGAAGAVAGFIIGGPTGAMYGAQIGMMAGGYLDPPKGPTMEGPRLSDLAVQTSTYGAPIGRAYGTVAISGTVFWLENNRLKEVVTKKKSGGKGGGGSSTTTKTYTYFATFAVGLCEGPIIGVRRIWAGNDLIYNGGSSVISSVPGAPVVSLGTIMASNAASKLFTVYNGDDTQLPDSRMQAEMGAANCPAYRGLAYIVFKDFALAKYGNSLQGCPIKVEVVKAGGYTALTQEGATISHASGVGNYKNMPFADETGCHLWEIGAEWQYSSTPMVYRHFIDNDGVIRLVRAASVTLLGADPSGAGIGGPVNGQCDANYFAVQHRNGNGGMTLLNADFAPAHFYNPIAGMEADHYCVSGDDVYYTATVGMFGSEIQLVKAGIAGGTGQRITLPFTTGGGASFALGFVGGLLCVGCTQASTSESRLLFIDPDSLAIVHNSLVSAYLANINFGSIEFDRDVMYFGTQSEALYSLTAYNATATYLGNFPGLTLPGSPAHMYRLFNRSGVFTTWRSFYLVPGGAKYFSRDVINPDAIPFSYIVSEECAASGLLSPSDIDVSDLTDTIGGMRIGKVGGIRNTIEILRGIRPFDMIQSGYQIKGVKRGSAAVVTIPHGDLGADEQLRQSREMDSQLPAVITASYLDTTRDYDVNQATWERVNTDAVNKISLEFPVVMSATQAAQAVEVLGAMHWLERVDIGPFKLPPTYSALEPSDVVTIETDYTTIDVAIRTINYKSDGSLECSGKLASASTYISTAAVPGTSSTNTVSVVGPSHYAILDIPLVDEVSQNQPGVVVAMCGTVPTWSGGILFQSKNFGQTWSDIQGFNGAGTFGFTGAPLGAHAGDLIQRGAQLTVSPLNGALYGITESEMISGENFAAYGADGRWEIIRFSGATLNANGSYTLSGFVRGDKGTEWATGLHQYGDLFVLLDDPDNTVVSFATSDIGAEYQYRGITSGLAIDTDTSTAMTYRGVNLECLSPVRAIGSRLANDLTVTWTRRSRLSSSWWATGVVAPIGETVEAYEVDVMDGATVKRTITSTTPTIVYTSAQQVADFGSNQSSVTVNIYQISSVVGRGYPLGATL